MKPSTTFVLVVLGLTVGIAFLAINIVGALLFLGGEQGLSQLARNSVASVTSFSLTPIPFFVLMGEVLFHTGVALKAIDAFALLAAEFVFRFDRLMRGQQGRRDEATSVG